MQHRRNSRLCSKTSHRHQREVLPEIVLTGAVTYALATLALAGSSRK